MAVTGAEPISAENLKAVVDSRILSPKSHKVSMVPGSSVCLQSEGFFDFKDSYVSVDGFMTADDGSFITATADALLLVYFSHWNVFDNDSTDIALNVNDEQVYHKSTVASDAETTVFISADVKSGDRVSLPFEGSIYVGNLFIQGL